MAPSMTTYPVVSLSHSHLEYKSTLRVCGICSLFIAVFAVIGPLIWKYRDHRQFNFRTSADEAILVPVDFSGKTIIVTGASSGIGKETVRVLLERGILNSVWTANSSSLDCDVVKI